MLYEFAHTLTFGGLASSLTAGTDRLTFVPNAVGNYDWSAN